MDRTDIRVFLSEPCGATWAHHGVLNDGIYDSTEWLDYPRSALIARETLETVAYFITDGVVAVGESISFVLAREFPDCDIEFWWADNIPDGAEVISTHTLTVTDIKESKVNH